MKNQKGITLIPMLLITIFFSLIFSSVAFPCSLWVSRTIGLYTDISVKAVQSQTFSTQEECLKKMNEINNDCNTMINKFNDLELKCTLGNIKIIDKENGEVNYNYHCEEN